MKEDANLAGQEKKKNLIAVACIAMAVVGAVLGIFFPVSIAGGFTAGTILSFAAFILSLGAVKDHGSNLPGMLAFTIGFLAMAASIFFGSGAV